MNTKKQNNFLSGRQADNLIAAWNHAEYYGFEFNYAITIHYALAGGPGDGTPQKRQARIFERLRKWLQRKGTDLYHIYVWEAGPFGKDVHSHCAIHIPHHINFGDFRRYLLKLLNPDDQSVLKIKPIRDNGWRRYMLKGISPDLRDKYGMPDNDKYRTSQGIVTGKRSGVSQSLGPKARERRIEAEKQKKAA